MLVWIGFLNPALISEVKVPSKPEATLLKYQWKLRQGNFSFLTGENRLLEKQSVSQKVTQHTYRNTEVTFLV